ncbi:hypothetical protein OCUAc17_12080 [Acinetobacter pittii]|uniref:hypothetical protein n=1 Tax=Acinetobacter TaxID=469 RepID=UPI0001CF7D53|nr:MULTISPECIES: hypothetical protein [Acinetobacter]EFF86438.1 hypothetical protein HMPREF0013_01771 [Acinetobacter sp. SH024]BCZ09833.1 hypothetical protein OCUAc17_12080 [Acinetobacter pittii]
MSEFKSCPVCQEESEQCLTCASYVVDGERIYYEKLKDFGATQDYELRFIQRIQKHRTTAFFHKGKLYIPSRQGRAVPLAIGLQWEAWQEQQAKVEELQNNINLLNEALDIKEQLNQKLREREDELQKRVDTALKLIQSWNEIAFDKTTHWTEGYEEGCYHCAAQLEQALKGDQYDEHRKKAEEAISKGASLTNHRIEL